MSHTTPFSSPFDAKGLELTQLIFSLPPARRGATLQSAVSFRPEGLLDESIQIGPLRAAFAAYWEEISGEAVPIRELRAALEPPIPIRTVLEFSRLTVAGSYEETEKALHQIVVHLMDCVQGLRADRQLSLFASQLALPETLDRKRLPIGESVSSLEALVASGKKFPTIYADPPWAYGNQASRGAAVNHYSTMSVDEICREPVRELADENSHLHLWTTNAFLRESFCVIEAWGFEFKSCLVWVKDEMGMGNYWRVSHEFLLLGIRGSLTFRDRSVRSWIQAHRTIHSRKPGVIRSIIERVSPGPYLELYGREELPDSSWTVYGNQIERRLF